MTKTFDIYRMLRKPEREYEIYTWYYGLRLFARDVRLCNSYFHRCCSIIDGVLGYGIYGHGDSFTPYSFDDNAGFSCVTGGFMNAGFDYLYAAYAIRNGGLYKITLDSENNMTCVRVGRGDNWQTLHVSFNVLKRAFFYGIAGGKLYAIKDDAVSEVIAGDKFVRFLANDCSYGEGFACYENGLYELMSGSCRKVHGSGAWTAMLRQETHCSTGSGDHTYYNFGICDGSLYRQDDNSVFSRIGDATGWTSLSGQYVINMNPGYAGEITYPYGVANGNLYKIDRDRIELVYDAGDCEWCHAYAGPLDCFGAGGLGYKIENGIIVRKEEYDNMIKINNYYFIRRTGL